MDAKKAYRESLRTLHGELEAMDVPAGSAYGVARTELLEDVREILEHPGELPFSHHRGLMERLEEGAEALEIAHPQLAGTIGSVIRALNAIGI